MPSNARTQAACDKAAMAELKPITARIDWDCLNRLSAFANQCRAEMGEDRWQQLSKEWE